MKVCITQAHKREKYLLFFVFYIFYCSLKLIFDKKQNKQTNKTTHKTKKQNKTTTKKRIKRISLAADHGLFDWEGCPKIKNIPFIPHRKTFIILHFVCSQNSSLACRNSTSKLYRNLIFNLIEIN